MEFQQRIDFESSDAEKVDLACDAINQGNLDKAEPLLLEVIHNTPKNYSNEVSDGKDGLAIKFWDNASFFHYITWQEKLGTKKSVTWISNAYPRAFYYLGLICSEKKRFDKSIKYLDQGALLEPTNPIFKLEKAHVLIKAGYKDESLALYSQINEVGLYVSNSDLAIAQRGCGFVLIEMGKLDQAEEAFNKSLKLEPENGIAKNELLYINLLRKGVSTTHFLSTKTFSPDKSICPVCGKKFSDGVLVTETKNREPQVICESCNSKMKKKWWQRWK